MIFRFAFGGGDSHCAALIQFGQKPIGVECLVAQQCAETNTFDERLHSFAIMGLAGQENKAGKIAERIDKGHDLGRQSTSRPPDGLSESPPFAPVAF